MENTHPYLWSKQNGLNNTYPLLAHLLDTVTVANALYEHWLRPELRNLITEELGENSKNIVLWVAGSHDIGKASPIFQAQPHRNGEEWDAIRSLIKEQGSFSFADNSLIGRLRKNEISFLNRHEQVGSFKISENKLLAATNRASKFWLSLPALGHHGAFTFPDRGRRDIPSLINKALNQGWSKAQDDLLEILSETLNVSRDSLPDEASPAIIVLLSGLTILADRIASGTEWVQKNQELLANGKLSLNHPAEWISSCTDRALQRVKDTVGIYQGWETQESAKQEILGSYAPRPLQQAALQAGDGLWNAMAPTGNGKTEAALLRHSLKNERLIFLLPTQATTNALMRRVQKAYSSTPNVAALAHGLSSIEDFYSRPVTVFSDTCKGKDNGGLYPTEFVKSGAPRLLAPVCVGTIDQPLMASIPMKWTHLRLLALANAHVVIDEVHTLDHYQSELLIPLLQWLGMTNTRVTFLSATFPQWQRDRFISAYMGGDLPENSVLFPAAEIISNDKTEIQQTPLITPEYTIDFEFSEPLFENLEKAHVEWVHKNRQDFPLSRLGVICNTVKRAQDVAQELIKQGEKVVLLHSRMTAEHRRINAELLEKSIGSGGNGTGITIIGTQAIEASLDIDLDLLSTDLCPAPSLIQRAGRVWRRKDTERGARVPGVKNLTIQVVKPSDPESWKLKPYFEAELTRTWNFLQDNRSFKCPTMNQEFVDYSSITLESVMTSEDLDQLAENSHALRKGKSRAEKLSDALKATSSIRAFSNMTDKNFNDSEDGAFTRLIESEIKQVILGGNPQQIPGAWDGTYQDLLSLRARNHADIQKALRASIPITITKYNRENLSQLPTLDQSETLLNRYCYLEIPAGEIYDEVLGFTGWDQQ